jgi:hypothetical protein
MSSGLEIRKRGGRVVPNKGHNLIRRAFVVINPHPTSFDGRMRGAATSRQRRDRRYALIVGIAFVFGLGASIWAMTVVTSRYSPGPPEAKTESRTGNIFLGPSAIGCRYFDNDTGRVLDSGTPCEKIVSRPVGTASRLDAISKSFFNNK